MMFIMSLTMEKWLLQPDIPQCMERETRRAAPAENKSDKPT